MNDTIENVVVRYIFDTDSVPQARARLLDMREEEAALAAEFREVNAAAIQQGRDLLAAAAAAKKAADEKKKATEGEGAALGRLQQLTDRLTAVEQQRMAASNNKRITELNQEEAAINREIEALRRLGLEQQETGKKTGMLGDLFRSAGPLIAGAFAADRLIDYTKKIIAATAEYQKFQAVLTNSLGSQSKANAVLLQLQQFAAKTPFSVSELTASFIKLNNQGFRPTTEELRKLGDLASSTGKSFDQLAEAILDAQSGETERLKEFGIKTKKSGDEMTFTFKGVSTTVKNTSSEIQKYLLSLGDLQGVSGSMAAISGTLEGQFSNLGDTADQLFLTIGKKLAPSISGLTSAAGTLLGNITQLIAGNEATAASSLDVFNAATANVVANKKLSDTYFELSAKTKLTSEEKDRLKSVSQQLIAVYGDSITQINKETGALEINTAALQKKILVEQVLQSEAARSLLAEKLRLETSVSTAISARGQIDALIQSVAGKGFDLVGAQLRTLGKAALDGGSALLSAVQRQRAGLLASGLNVQEYNNRVAAVLPTLQRLAGAITFESSNRERLAEINQQLLDQGIDLEALAKTNLEDSAAANKATTERLGILGQLRKELAELQKQEATASKAQLPGLFDAEADLKVRIAALEALTNRNPVKVKISLAQPSETEISAALDELTRLVQKDQDAANAKRVTGELAFLETLAQEARQFHEADYTKQLGDLDGQLRRKEITVQQYEAKRRAAEANLKKSDIDSDIAFATEELKIKGLTSDQTVSIEEKKNARLRELYGANFEAAKEAEAKIQELKQKAFETGVQLINALFDAEKQNIDDRLSNLSRTKDYELALAGDTKGAKEKINADFARKEAALRAESIEAQRKQAVFNKAIAIGQIAIYTAQAIMKALADVPFPLDIVQSVLYGVIGAAQIGAVLAQPLPKYAVGTRFVEGPGTGTSDSILARLSRGERVITAEKNARYAPILDAIHDGSISAEVLNKFALDIPDFSFTMPTPAGSAAVVVEAPNFDPLIRAIENQPRSVTIFDADGFSQHTEQGQNRETSLNKRIFPD